MPQALYVPRPTLSALGLAAQTVIKSAPGKVWTVSVTTAGTTAGSINDTATVAGIAAGNLIGVFETVGIYIFDQWPCANGIVFTPGTGMVASVSFS